MKYFLACLVLCIGYAAGKSAKQTFLDKLATDKYDADERPPFKNGTMVTVDIYFRNFPKLSLREQTMDVQMTLRQEWNDPRLVFDGEEKVTLNDPSKIWTPDTFIQNSEKSARHGFNNRPDVMIVVKPSGAVFYSQRISATVSCRMDFREFPHDRQRCNVVLGSYSHSIVELSYAWRKVDPIQIVSSEDGRAGEYVIEALTTDIESSKTPLGTYSGLSANFTFMRNAKTRGCCYYTNTLSLVVLAWIALFMDRNNIAGRVTLGSVCLILVHAYIIYGTVDLPAVNYTKSIDVWNGVCVAMIWFSLFESVLVSTLSACCKEGGAKCCLTRRCCMKKEETTGEEKEKKCLIGEVANDCHFTRDLPRCLDCLSRAGFPIIFAIFAAGYAICIHT